MELGMVGLGRMGANLVRRLHARGFECVVHDHDPAVVDTLVGEGVAVASRSSQDLVARLQPPRVVWIMVPAAAADEAIDAIVPHLAAGDTIIDGGNGHYRRAMVRATELADLGIHHLDVGTSGGIFGLERGYCLMIGGDIAAVERLTPLFEALAPGPDAAPRTPTRRGAPIGAESGYLHCGPAGAGHYTKMVHNGIEYAMMAAYAEGLNLLSQADLGSVGEPHRFDVAATAEVWRRGSVISSWLLDLTAAALADAGGIDERFRGHVADSGEGRWMVTAAVEAGVPVPTIADALFARFASQGKAATANQILSAMRAGFGGHIE